MSRPLRIEFAGALYHITSRGDRREDIFVDDEDREQFLELLAEVCERYKWACHAYCLMSNHYHLLVETRESTLGKGMRQLNGVYTQAFNRRHHGSMGSVSIDLHQNIQSSIPEARPARALRFSRAGYSSSACN